MKKTAAFLMALALCVCFLGACASEKTDGQPSSLASESTEKTGRLQEILDRGYLTVETETYFAPNEFIDPSKSGDDRYVGSDIEFAKYIAAELGVDLQIVPLEFGAVLSSIAEGKYDLAISGLGYTPARAETMLLSDGYWFPDEVGGYGLMIREEDLGTITGADSFADKTIVAQSGSLQELFVTNEIKEYKEFKRVSSTNDAALSVTEKKADAASVSIDWAELYIEQNPGCGLTVVPDFLFTVGPEYSAARIGMPLGAADLEEKINEIVAKVVESGQYDEWYAQYTEYAKELGIE